ncbi:MAG: hypothetical protein KAS36_01770 [Anaerolineales bacterium]|nr:hypothetical protein [Anaerolineales bacterium]
MSDPGQRRGCAVSDILLVVLLVGLVYVVYTLLGGDLSSALTRLSNSGGAGPVEQVTGSMRALGESIGNAFSNMLR